MKNDKPVRELQKKTELPARLLSEARLRAGEKEGEKSKMEIKVTITQTNGMTSDKVFDRFEVAFRWALLKIQQDEVSSVNIEKENEQ